MTPGEAILFETSEGDVIDLSVALKQNEATPRAEAIANDTVVRAFLACRGVLGEEVLEYAAEVFDFSVKARLQEWGDQQGVLDHGYIQTQGNLPLAIGYVKCKLMMAREGRDEVMLNNGHRYQNARGPAKHSC